MAEITFGNISIISRGDRLIFQDRENPKRQFALSPSTLTELVAFLRNMNPDGTEQRVGFRVPLSESKGLTARIAHDEKQIPVKPLDISLSGMLFELRGDVAELPVGAELIVTLQHGQKNATLPALVCRRFENRYGISFPDSQLTGELDPPDSLLVIFKRLETEWFRKQIEIGHPIL